MHCNNGLNNKLVVSLVENKVAEETGDLKYLQDSMYDFVSTLKEIILGEYSPEFFNKYVDEALKLHGSNLDEFLKIPKMGLELRQALNSIDDAIDTSNQDFKNNLVYLLNKFQTALDNMEYEARDPYDTAVELGFIGTKQEWLEHLEGDSAYEIAVKNGYVGTEEEWLANILSDTDLLNNVRNGANTLAGYISTIPRTVNDAISNAVISSGFVTIDSFELGATITQRNEALRHTATGNLYRWAGNLPKAVAAGSTPTSTGGFGDNAWLEVSDTTLRQDFLDPAKWKDTLKGLPFVTPEMYGAKGDGVTVDSDAVTAMIAAAGVGGTIQLLAGKTYIIDREISMLDSQTLIGNSATLKREAQHVTTTTTAVTSSSSELTVVDASKFRVGQRIAIAQNGVARESLKVLTTLSTTRIITSIVGNVITISGTIGIGATSGSTVFTAYSAVDMVNGCKVIGTIFDGNKDNWSFNRWEVTCEVNMAAVASTAAGLIVENNTFINSPSEAIIARCKDSLITGNVCKNINGNFVHTSNARNLIISENFGYKCNMDVDVGHQDGFISISQQNFLVMIRDNIASECISGVSPLNTGNADIIVDTNIFSDMYCFGILGNACEGSVVRNNRLHNIPTNTAYKTGYSHYEPMDLNVFTKNTIISGNVITGVVGSGYALKVSGPYTDETTSASVFNNYVEGSILMNGHGIDFHDNTVTSELRLTDLRNSSMKNNRLYGLRSSGNNELKNVVISGNTIKGAANGIYLSPTLKLLDNFVFSDNFLIDCNTTGIYISGIAVAKGCWVKGNTITTTESAKTSFIGIRVSIDGFTIKDNQVTTEQSLTTGQGIRLGEPANSYSKLLGIGNEVRGDWFQTILIPATATGVTVAYNILEGKDISGVAASPETNSIVFNAPEPEPEPEPTP